MKLLRVLQTGEFERLGSSVDTSGEGAPDQRNERRPAGGDSRGTFREDLYYRLNVIELRVPPLAERREDILPLARALPRAGATRSARPRSERSPRITGRATCAS